MKKLFLFIVATMLVTTIFGQSKFSISFGPKFIDSKANCSLMYVDESPSRDNIVKNIEDINKLTYNVIFRWTDNDSPKPLKSFVDIQGYIGNLYGLSLNFGYLYNKNSGKTIRLQPEIAAVLGFNSKSIGEIENNSVYIQVNDTQFKDNTNVKVSVNNAYIGIKPGLSFVFKVGKKNELGFGACYQLSYKIGFLAFNGEVSGGNKKTEYEMMSEDNVHFYVNNTRTDKNPINPDGLELKLFLSF